MKNPPGLIKISTGGSAMTTTVEVDGHTVLATRATIIIDPANGENHIKLHGLSRQANNTYEDGEVETFYGISKENFEFMKELLQVVSKISDNELADIVNICAGTSDSPVAEFWRFLHAERNKP